MVLLAQLRKTSPSTRPVLPGSAAGRQTLRACLAFPHWVKSFTRTQGKSSSRVISMVRALVNPRAKRQCCPPQSGLWGNAYSRVVLAPH